MKQYYVGLARGADFKDLKARGFTVFYPVLDDYVFLEVTDENKKLLTKQDELKVKFLRDQNSRTIQQVTEKELSAMVMTTQDILVEGQDISVVEGFGTGLEGKIFSRDGEALTCDLYGYKRVFRVVLTTIQVVKRGVEVAPPPQPEGLL